jgi:hypothetical protein
VYKYIINKDIPSGTEMSQATNQSILRLSYCIVYEERKVANSHYWLFPSFIVFSGGLAFFVYLIDVVVISTTRFNIPF